MNILLILRAAVLGTSASEKKAERDPRSDRSLDLLLAGASPKEGSEICRAWLKAYDAERARWIADVYARRHRRLCRAEAAALEAEAVAAEAATDARAEAADARAEAVAAEAVAVAAEAAYADADVYAGGLCRHPALRRAEAVAVEADEVAVEASAAATRAEAVADRAETVAVAAAAAAVAAKAAAEVAAEENL